MSKENTQALEATSKRVPIQQQVLTRVNEMQSNKELVLPTDYVAENALNAAYLALQETVDRNQKPALEVTSQVSQANALLSMVVQGLNPVKDQCYFVVYGKELTMVRSYFGSMAVAKRVDDNVIEFQAQVVYDGEEVTTSIVDGKDYVTEHIRDAFGGGDREIVGAYCTVIRKEGGNYSVVMTMDEIKKSWGQSPMKPVEKDGTIKPFSTHGKFPAEMAKRTVINRTCKQIINTSGDGNIVSDYARQSDVDTERYRAESEIEENANQGDIIDAEYMEVVDEHEDEIEEVSADEQTEQE